MTNRADVAVVGAGVIGLSIADVLGREGARVVVVDQSEPGRAASWAGAGMIPPYAERVRANPTLDLRSWSAMLYPEWSARLLEETGIDNGFRRTGGVDVGGNAQEDAELRSMAGRWRAERVVYERLEPSDFRRVEPALNPNLLVAYYLPDRAQIRNPRHIRALLASIASRGNQVLANAEVRDFEVRGDRVASAVLEGGKVEADRFVISAGAWSAGLLDRLDRQIPTPPLKGQIVLLRSDRGLIRRIVEHGKMYLVPREDHRVLVGATEEWSGFDDRPTPEGALALVEEAYRLCPILREATVERSWGGLRPGTIDSRPYLGFLEGYVNLIVATGHKRAGIQLAPATAEVIADLAMGRPSRIDLAPFRPGREPSFVNEATFRS